MGFKKSAEMKKLFCSLSLLAVVTTSCSYIGVMPPHMPPTSKTGDPINEAIEQAQKLRDDYVEYSRDKIASLPLYNLLLLGTAGVGIGGLLFDSHPDFVAIAGLAGGSVAGIKTVLNPAAVATAYIDGADALNCVIESAKPLMSENRKADLKKPQEIVKSLKDSKIDTVETKLSTLKIVIRNKQVSSDLRIPADEAESNATAALSATQDALVAFDNESKADRDARAEVPIQISTIHAKVSKKILDTHNVSFSDLQAAITGTITSITQQKAAIDAIRKNLREIQLTSQTDGNNWVSNGQNDLVRLITDLNSGTLALKTETRKLLNVMPNFKEALGRTKMCAAAL